MNSMVPEIRSSPTPLICRGLSGLELPQFQLCYFWDFDRRFVELQQ